MKLNKILTIAAVSAVLSTSAFAASFESKVLTATTTVAATALINIASTEQDATILGNLGIAYDLTDPTVGESKANTSLKVGAVDLFANGASGYTIKVTSNTGTSFDLINAGSASNGFTNRIPVNSISIKDTNATGLTVNNDTSTAQTGVQLLVQNKDVTLDVAKSAGALISGAYTQAYTITITAQ